MFSIRPAAETDLDEIWRIQSASGEAAQWRPADYMQHICLVACVEERIAGFVVARRVAADEIEILSAAVDAPSRRRGAARALIQQLIGENPGSAYLEVRQSNVAARKLYHSLGFETIAVRQEYYSAPVESAIVMKFHSC
jgi:ribosomal-protein-alanine N-acetyltransferase